MNWLKKNKEILFLLMICIVFFGIYAHFNLLPFQAGESGVKFSSPDETANYFWIKRFSQGEPLYYLEELNGAGTNLIHPRSMNSVEGKITPGSFFGMIFIYGWLAKIFGLGLAPYLTPLFAGLGIVFFYLLIKAMFKRQPIALISAILLSFTPAWFYYSSRGMYHNALFMSLLIIGVYALWKCLEIRNWKLETKDNFQFSIPNRSWGQAFNFQTIFNVLIFNYLLYFASGLLIGGAIITRTSEIAWVGMTVLLVFVLNFKKIYWPGGILFLAGLWLAALPVFYWNQILYGSLISAGYRTALTSGGIGEAIQSGVLFQMMVTPFGFNLKSIIANGFNYLYKFLPYWSAPAIIGGWLWLILPAAIIKINYKKRIIYLAYCLLLTAYLLIFYGSWSVVDRIDKESLSLGTSYLRYWLPIYIIILPFIASLIWLVGRLVVPPRSVKPGLGYPKPGLTTFLVATGRLAVITSIILLLFMPSINLTIRKTDESLFLLKNLSEARVKSGLINQLVKPDDIVITYKQADKIFFPERPKLITELAVPADYEAVARLAKLRAVYYYTFAPASTVEFISRRDFEPWGMRIGEGKRVLGSDWIYKIISEDTRNKIQDTNKLQ